MDQSTNVGDSHLKGGLLKIKCEWVGSKSIRNGGNVGYIRYDTRITNTLKFLMQMWCLNLLVIMN